MAEGRMWAETGLDGSVWAVRAGNRNPETSQGHPDGFRASKPVKTGQKPKRGPLCCRSNFILGAILCDFATYPHDFGQFFLGTPIMY